MFILTLLPWPHLAQMFAVGTASAPQFEQNIWELKELDVAMLDLSPTAFACTIRAQDPFLWFWFCCELFAFAVSFLLLPRGFWFAVSFLVLPWAFWFCREHFGFAVRNLLLPWAFWFCRGEFDFAVTFLVLPWGIYYCRDSCGPPYSSLWSRTAVQIYELFHIYFTSFHSSREIWTQ